MGKVLACLVGTYVLLVVLPAVFVVGRASLFLLVLVAAVVWLYRGRRFALGGRTSLRLAAGARTLPASTSATSARHLEEALARLEAQLSEDPLENPLLVAVLAALLHEPPEERARVEDEYRSYRRRFLALCESVRRLADGANPSLPAYPEVEAELAAIESYLAKLEDRAAEADVLADKALDDTTLAGDAVAEARAAWEALGERRPPRLGEQLDAAAARYREAWTALEKGRERPSTACRLAAEALELADAVKRDAARVAGLPVEVDRRLAALDASGPTVERDLERVRDEFASVAESYAPSCWQEIGGAGHAAQRALERARRLGASAARLRASGEPAKLEEATAGLDGAEEALDEAARLVATIDQHVSKLETAALGGRERIVEAEREADKAQAVVRALPPGDGARQTGEELLRRAGELTARGRGELARARPDWLTVADLADRSLELARLARSERAEAHDGLEELCRALEHVETRALHAPGLRHDEGLSTRFAFSLVWESSGSR